MTTDYVLTVILPKNHKEAAPDTSGLSLTTAMNQSVNLLTDEGFDVTSQTILAENSAADIVCRGPADVVNQLNLKEHLSEQDIFAFDAFFQPTQNRRKKLLIADMDSTMITIECIDELADYAGIKDQVAEITERAMQGELDFTAALTERVALLKGMKASVLEECYSERVKFSEGAKALVQTMAKSGAVTALVSGGFTFFTEKVSKELGFQLNRANRLGIEDGLLTGTVIPPISNSQTKIDTLNELLKQNGLNSADSIAVGDGANDIPMIEGAGIGVAYKAKEKARKAADFYVTHTCLKSLLYIQGYKETDIQHP